MSDTDNDKVVLIVDDEEMVLSSISSFLELETSYKVVTFTEPGKALEYVNENSIDLVISDYLMPHMNGIQFLSKMKEVMPQVPRIILTGYADKENAIKAINDVGLFQYIEKPWDNDDILLIIRNGLERKELMKKLDDKISQINAAYSELQGLHKEIVKTFI
ncbi:MAG: response regulator [Calditrichaeota bacterium]|nr:MAG: response regulator [Calditrichota bacterium]